MARYNRQKRSLTKPQNYQTNNPKPEDNQPQSANVRNKGNGSVIMAIALALISGATLIGGYYQPDLIVKIQSDRVLTCIPLETRPIAIGQPVYALSNPLGMESTFTNGMVSRIEGNGNVLHTTKIEDVQSTTSQTK
jgi:hypothetical protein